MKHTACHAQHMVIKASQERPGRKDSSDTSSNISSTAMYSLHYYIGQTIQLFRLGLPFKATDAVRQTVWSQPTWGTFDGVAVQQGTCLESFG